MKNLARKGLDLDGIRRALRGDGEQGPTLEAFWPDFLEGYVKANREKFSSLRSRKSIYRHHFQPWYGLPLSAITDQEVQKPKGRLADRKPKTVNNVLTCLSTVLKAAVAWDRLAEMPCSIRLLKVDNSRGGQAAPNELVRDYATRRPRMSRRHGTALEFTVHPDTSRFALVGVGARGTSRSLRFAVSDCGPLGSRRVKASPREVGARPHPLLVVSAFRSQHCRNIRDSAPRATEIAPARRCRAAVSCRRLEFRPREP